MRSDPYDLPPDVPQYETPVHQRRAPTARLPDPDDSPLSEDELEAVYGHRSPSRANASPAVSPTGSRTSFEHGQARLSREPSPARKPDAGDGSLVKVGIPTQEAAPDMSFLPRVAANGRKSMRPPTKRAAVVAVEPQPANGTSPAPEKVVRRREIIQTDSLMPKISRRKTATPKRRLPIDELLLVASPPEQSGYLREPESSSAGIQMQDPIADTSSPAQKLAMPRANGKNPPKERPLTSIRKRLKTPNHTHGLIDALHKKQNDHKPKSVKAERDLGDGFDASELVIRYCRVKKRRTHGITLLRGLGALQLQHGPLPEVKFEGSNGELKTEPEDDTTPAVDYGENAPIDALSHTLGGGRSNRRVMFSDDFFDEATRAQLSSVSAPKRIFEISSDESEEEDEEDDEDDDCDVEQSELPKGDLNYKLQDEDVSLNAGTPPSFQRARQLPSPDTRDGPDSASLDIESARNSGVTLDFRKSATPGLARQPLHKQKLMEVDEMIIDDPFVEGFTTVPKSGVPEHKSIPDHRRIREEMPASYVRRPRSILRSNAPVLQSGLGTRPEDTLENTRRNSNIAVESAHFQGAAITPRTEREDNVRSLLRSDSSENPGECLMNAEPHNPYHTTTRRRKTAVTLEDDNASYFGVASNQLQQAQKESKPPNRHTSHRPDLAASHFFAQRRREAELHVLDSSRVVPETSSPRKKDFMTDIGMSLNVVRRDEETTWTSSQSLPSVQPPKSLKSLTRSVSKEFGTMSQAGRRRPSLPFQSPVKVARQLL